MELPRQDGVDAGAASDAGPRPDNQDRCVVSSRWAVVSDGVGGHAGGALAAELTVAAVLETLGAPDPGGGSPPGGGAGEGGGGAGAGVPVSEAVLRRAVTAANDAVRAGRRDDPAVADMGATLTVAAATSVGPEESHWLVASVGDSPAWLVTPAEATPLTQDHTMAAELMRAGAISAEEAARHPGRHVIIRSIGGEDRVAPDVTAATLRPGEAIVIASDGVGDVLAPTDVRDVTVGAPTAAEAARRLVESAVGRGATDNVTAAVVRQVASSGGGPPGRDDGRVG